MRLTSKRQQLQRAVDPWFDVGTNLACWTRQLVRDFNPLNQPPVDSRFPAVHEAPCLLDRALTFSGIWALARGLALQCPGDRGSSLIHPPCKKRGVSRVDSITICNRVVRTYRALALLLVRKHGTYSSAVVRGVEERACGLFFSRVPLTSSKKCTYGVYCARTEYIVPDPSPPVPPCVTQSSILVVQRSAEPFAQHYFFFVRHLVDLGFVHSFIRGIPDRSSSKAKPGRALQFRENKKV